MTGGLIVCEGGCGRSTWDPDKWDPEADTGRIFCDTCWPHRDDFGVDDYDTRDEVEYPAWMEAAQ